MSWYLYGSVGVGFESRVSTPVITDSLYYSNTTYSKRSDPIWMVNVHRQNRKRQELWCHIVRLVCVSQHSTDWSSTEVRMMKFSFARVLKLRLKLPDWVVSTWCLLLEVSELYNYRVIRCIERTETHREQHEACEDSDANSFDSKDVDSVRSCRI